MDKILKNKMDTPLARYVGERTDAMVARGKTQRELSYEAGWKSPNLISMIRNGDAKLPLNKVAQLAAAIEADPGTLLRLALFDFLGGEDTKAVRDVLEAVVTANELEFIRKIRVLTKGSNPEMTPALSKALEKAFAHFSPENTDALKQALRGT